MIEAGVLGLRLQPIATGFWRQTDAKLRAQKASTAEVKVEANIRKASTEIAMFRMREQANAINLRVKVDENSIRTATDKIKYVEHTWKQSDIKRAIRVQVYTAGASALPALTQGLMSVTAAMTELSRVSLALPGLLAGIGSAAATLLTGLNGVGAAFKASGDGMKNSSQYAKEYARATRDLEDAQRDVVKALKDANRELEDQKSKLARGQLSVEEAQLNVRRANEAMFKGGFKSITDYQQALLDVKSANLDLSDAVKENSRNISDYYENAGRGAAGSNLFKDSLDKLANSVDNFHKAQFQAAGMSEQFINAMKMLAPAGQDFVLQVLKMKGAWLGLQGSVQTTLFKGLGDEITNLANKQLPMLKTGMQQVAAGLNDGFKSIFASLGRQTNTNSIAKIFENTGKAISASTPGLDSFTSGLLKLSEVGSRFLPRIALAFDKVMGRFEAFINKADQDGSLNRWIDSGLKLVASLGRSLLSIGSILDSVTEAYNKATGNVGGFASTMERGLASFAKKLASPEGQGALIKWMRTSREFMATIADSLPGIGKLLGALGDGAREFAALWFPKLAQFGNLVGGSAGAMKTLVAATLTWRTAAPVISSVTKLWNLLNASMQKYTEKKAALLSTRTGAWKAAFDADGVKFAAEQRLRFLRDELKETDNLYTRMLNSRVAGQRTLAQAERDREAAEAKAKASKKAANKDGLDPIAAKNAKAVYKADAEAFKQAKQVEATALADFNMRDERFTNAAAERSRVRKDLEVNRGKAYRDVRVSTDLATKAQENFNKVNRLTADGMSGKWARSVELMKGKYQGLKSALGFIGGVGASAGIAVGVAVAFDQLTAAQDRNKQSADNLKTSQDALAQTLSKGTGAATAATLEENVRQLKDRANPVHPDDRGQNFDAAKILEGQLGIPLAEAASLALPTEIKKREARLAPADSQVSAAVPTLDIWKKWGSEFQKNGVTAAIYGKALNGDPDSMAKVAAAREVIKNERTPGLNMGAAVVAGSAPNDLGAAQEQLPRSGPYGGLRGLSLATGAERSIGNEAYNQGQKLFENAQVIPQKGLNKRGSRAFGPFVLGAHGAILNPDGSATIEVDRYPDEVVKGWTDGANDKGISVERRFPNGAVISIDAEHGRQYFNGYAMGGPVWGAGTATSDSIPAMLSNGEFVINAKSASLIGHDKLHAMNKYANGGLVRGFEGGGSPGDSGSGSIIGNAWDWFKNLISPDPVGMVPGDSRRPDAAENNYGPYQVPTPTPPVRTDPVDSAPVERPYTPPTPPPPTPKGIGANIGGGNLYIPRFGGNGALPDTISYPGFVGTDASRAANAEINPDANILDYLVQVANANGLTANSGPAGPDAAAKAKQLGINTHDNDGAQHSVDRALDIGNSEQAQSGSISNFVRSWMADPQKVAATRQLIYQDPKTGEAFAIHHGVAYVGKAAYDVYGNDFPQHRDHAHISMEGVPLNAFTASSTSAPVPVTGPTTTTAPPKVTPGPAASAPKGDVQIASPDAVPGTIPGPFGAIPFDPIYILKQIGAAILNGIFSFFGIDGSGFVDALFALGDKPIGPQVTDVPEPDQELVSGLDAQIAQYEALGTPTGKEMADQIRAGKDKYLKQFEGQDAAKSAESAAAYFDSIGQPDVAAKLRAGVQQNPERFSPVTTVPGTGVGPTVLPRPSGGSGSFIAPPAAYSGGTPETHNAIYRAFKEAGYPDSEWPSLIQLLNHENDTYDPTRPTGGPNSDARGIFQFLSSTWGSVGMQPSDDPYMQSVAGMKYIKQNYATPTGAWMFWQHPTRAPFDQNWYSRGGLAKFARGGMVKGPGTGTSDSIPAMLSAGEFVMRADAVKSIGADRLHAMNCYSGGGYVRMTEEEKLRQAFGLTPTLTPPSYDPVMQIMANIRTGDIPQQKLFGKPPRGTSSGLPSYLQDIAGQRETDSGAYNPLYKNWSLEKGNFNPDIQLDPSRTSIKSAGNPILGQTLERVKGLGKGLLNGFFARNIIPWGEYTGGDGTSGIGIGFNPVDTPYLSMPGEQSFNSLYDLLPGLRGDQMGTVMGKAKGGLIRRYAPGGPVIPIDPNQQKAMLRDAFQTRSNQGMLGGGGNFNSAPAPAPTQRGYLDKVFGTAVNVQSQVAQVPGGIFGVAKDAVSSISQLLPDTDSLLNGSEAERTAEKSRLGETYKGLATGLASLLPDSEALLDGSAAEKAAERDRLGQTYSAIGNSVINREAINQGRYGEAFGTIFGNAAGAVGLPGYAGRSALTAGVKAGELGRGVGLKSISPGPRQASIPGENALIPNTDIEIPTAFDPYKMRRTQAAWVKKNTKGIDFHLAGIPKAAQQEIKASMAYLQSVAPTKMHEVVVDWDLAAGDSNTLAYTNLGVRASTGKVGGRIMVNPNHFKSVYQSTQDAKGYSDPFGPYRSFHPNPGTKGGFFSTMAHEYGHVLDMMHLWPGEANRPFLQYINDIPEFGNPLKRYRAVMRGQNSFANVRDSIDPYGIDGYRAENRSITNRKSLSDKRYRELLDEKFGDQFADVTDARVDQLGYSGAYSSKEYAKFIRSRLSGYSYKTGRDMELVSGLREGQSQSYRTEAGLNGNTSLGRGTVQDLITAIIVGGPGSPLARSFETMFGFMPRATQRVSFGQKLGPELNPAEWALRTINRNESIAEAFGDVMSRGDKAERGHKTVYNVLQEQLSQRGVNIPKFADADYTGRTEMTQGLIGQGWVDRASSDKIFAAFKGMVRPFIDTQTARRKVIDEERAKSQARKAARDAKFGLRPEEESALWASIPTSDNPANPGLEPPKPTTWVGPSWEPIVLPEGPAKGLANKSSEGLNPYYEPKSITPKMPKGSKTPPKPGSQGALTWDTFAKQADDIWPFSIEEGAQGREVGRDGNPLGSPFARDQFDALVSYSASSTVNKSMRGMDQLPLRRRILEELIAIHPEMQGRGGRFAATKPGEVLRIIGDNKGLPARDIINKVREQKPYLTEREIWEAWFVEHLATSRLRAAAVINAQKQADLIDSAFYHVPPLPKDMWVTRMVEDFGPGVDVGNPQSLVGQLLPANPAFSSTSGGLTNTRPSVLDGWKMRGGKSGSNPFQGRNIMQQILVPGGTRAIWFGGGENELLLESGLQYLPRGQMDIRQAAGLDPDESRYVDMVNAQVEEMTGKPVARKTKFWGGAEFDRSALPHAFHNLGLKELEAVMRPLGADLSVNEPPGWMKFMDMQSPNSVVPPYSEFRDMPALHALNYAAGGHVSGPGGPKSDMIPAMLSNGEFVMNAAATRHWGTDRLHAMNRYEAGGLVPPPMTPIIQPPMKIEPPPPPPSGSSDPDAFKSPTALDLLNKPLVPSSGSSDPDAFKNLDNITPANLAGTLLSPKGVGGGVSASARAPRSKDPRSILGAAPTSDNHTNPALAGGIKGVFNTIGSIASTAASLAAAGSTMGASAAVPGGSAAASALISAGTQMAGDVAVGAANVISSLLVGTVTPSDTGQGYGAPLLPQQQPGSAMNNFQSIHNGNVVTNNLTEYSRLKDRKDAQKAAPFFSRVNQ